MAFAEVAPGVLLEYEFAGDGPTVVLLHGLGGSLELERQAAEKTAARGYRVLWFSCRGAGRSTLPGGAALAYRDFAADLGALLSHTGVAAPVLVGGSHGANTVLRFLCEHPGVATRALLLGPGMNALDPPSGRIWLLYRMYHALLRVRSDDAFIKAITGIDAASAPHAPIVIAARTHDIATARRMARFVPAQNAADRDALRTIATPTHVVAWRGDAIHDFAVAREIAERIPNATFEEIDRARLVTPDERDTAVADAIDRFARSSP